MSTSVCSKLLRRFLLDTVLDYVINPTFLGTTYSFAQYGQTASLDVDKSRIFEKLGVGDEGLEPPTFAV